jgi:hypothetical protein
MPNPFLISILTLITTLATTPTIANTNRPIFFVDLDGWKNGWFWFVWSGF